MDDLDRAKEDLRMMEAFVKSPEWEFMSGVLSGELRAQDELNRGLPFVGNDERESIQIGQGRARELARMLTFNTYLVNRAQYFVEQAENQQKEGT